MAIIGAAGVAGAVVLFAGVVFWAGNVKELPPTGFTANHWEQFPPVQVNTSPIPRQIQEHVMERGGGHHETGSMLVQYNCDDYLCGPDTIEQLTAIVRDYPDNVFLAPYPGMDAAIALAAPNRLVTLDFLDEVKVRKFLDDNLKR